MTQQRFRFLDFGADRFVAGSGFLRLTRVFWPVDMFRITFPSRPEADVETNAFERLVLRLLEQGAWRSVKALSEESCLDEDLIETIVRQLQDKGFIDGELRPDSETLQKIGLGNGEVEPEKFDTAVVFRERLNGRLLPFIHILSGTGAIRREEGFGEDFVDWEQNEIIVPPSQNEIRAMIRAMRNGARLAGDEHPRISANLVSIESKSERARLSCHLYFENDSGRILVSNPFGAGCSAVLTAALEDRRLALPSLEKRVSVLVREFIDRVGDQKNNRRRGQRYTENVSEKTRELYPKFADRLRTTEEHPYLSSWDVYAALEWAMFYACKRAPVEPALVLIEDGYRAEDLPKRIYEISRQLHFECRDRRGNPFVFPPVPAGKILDFRNEKANMDADLAISLLQASVEKESAPISSLARVRPDFFRLLDELRAVRNEQYHGTKRDARDGHTPFLERFLPVFTALLPDADIAVDGLSSSSGKEKVESYSRHIRDAIVSTRIQLQSQFGFNLFSRLNETQVENLVKAKQNIDLDGEDADRLVFLKGVTNVFQTLLAKRIHSREFREAVSREPFEQALFNRKQELGLSKVLERPEFRINKRNRDRAAAGNPATLAACVLCFVAWEDTGILQVLGEQYGSSGFVEIIADLLKYREHGNDRVLLCDKRVVEFRIKPFSLLKTLMETLP